MAPEKRCRLLTRDLDRGPEGQSLQGPWGRSSERGLPPSPWALRADSTRQVALSEKYLRSGRERGTCWGSQEGQGEKSPGPAQAEGVQVPGSPGRGELPTVGVRGAGGWSGLGWGEVGTTRGRGVREILRGDCAGAGGAEAGGQPA